MSQFYQNSVFWIETEKIKPNPHQPRKDFDPVALQSLADSVRQYGILQALVVTRKEIVKPEGGLAVEYELIAGERRLRAAKIAGLSQVPALIREGTKEEDDLLKLELAIIENIQREDLNPVDRAKAFHRLADEFGFKHGQIAQKVGKSREYVTNTLRILSLPEFILEALSDGKISEGHTRPLMMLVEKPQEQETLFKEIVYRKLTVRDAEAIARRVASDRSRKTIDPRVQNLEKELSDTFGTRVHIEKSDRGGKISISFFSDDDFESILGLIHGKADAPKELSNSHSEPEIGEDEKHLLDDRSKEEKEEEDSDLYFLKNFSI